MMELMRISKYLSVSGITSRRKAEELIRSGRITINGKIITDLSFKIIPDLDIVKLDGNIIKMNVRKIYIKLFKPAGYITSSSDEFGRKTVLDLIDINERIFSIGRLDKDTRGLLLLTNDGDLAYKITHPKYEIEKTYRVRIKGEPKDEELNMLKVGIDLDDFKTSPAKIKLLNVYHNTCDLLIKIHEGKKRQIRRMFEYIGHPVIDLIRLKIGPIELGDLKEGQWVYMNNTELNSLKKYLEVGK